MNIHPLLICFLLPSHQSLTIWPVMKSQSAARHINNFIYSRWWQLAMGTLTQFKIMNTFIGHVLVHLSSLISAAEVLQDREQFAEVHQNHKF